MAWVQVYAQVAQVDIGPGESPMDGAISEISEKGLEWLTRTFGLGRQSNVARLDLMDMVNRR